MHAVIANHIGRIHHALQHLDLASTRPCYAFVPDEYMLHGNFDRPRYLASRWPSINAGANVYAIGSHVIPDPTKPVSNRSRCSVLREFISRLENIAVTKAIPPKT